MLATRDVWEELVRQAKALEVFADVRALPVQRVADQQFLRVLPDLKLPACLIVYKGRADEVKGAARDRTSQWSAVIACQDAKGEAWVAAVELLDHFAARFLDRQIMEKELTIHGSHDVDVPFVTPTASVVEVAFVTREARQR